MVRLHLSARTVTTISAVAAVCSSLVLLRGTITSYIISAALMQVFLLLDHVDGEVARYNSLGSAPSAVKDFSGSYYDRLVHYFQGPTFYFCLGAALWLGDGQFVWLVLGLIGTIGSSGFPRFVASYEMLEILLKSPSAVAEDYVRRASGYYSIYWAPGEEPAGIGLPRTFRELVFAAKQMVGFPGHMFLFLAAAVITYVSTSVVAVRLYLAFYGLLLGANTVFATMQYLRVLSRVPSGSRQSDEAK